MGKLQEYVTIALVVALGLVVLQLRCDRAQFRAEKANWVGRLDSFQAHVDGSAKAAKDVAGSYAAIQARLDEIGGDVAQAVKTGRQNVEAIGEIKATLEGISGGGKPDTTTDEYAEYRDDEIWIRYWLKGLFEYRQRDHELKYTIVQTIDGNYVLIDDLTTGEKIKVTDAHWISYEPEASFWEKLKLGGGILARQDVDIAGAVVYGKYVVLITKSLVQKDSFGGWRLNTRWSSGLGIGIVRFLW